jgi:hypothetical protein
MLGATEKSITKITNDVFTEYLIPNVVDNLVVVTRICDGRKIISVYPESTKWGKTESYQGLSRFWSPPTQYSEV